MPTPVKHKWNITPREAIQVQQKICGLVVRRNRIGRRVRLVAGVDVGFEKGLTVTRAAVAVLSYPALVPVAQAIARRKTTFPYVPGLLTFRELPAILAAIRKLELVPDLWLCDGQGVAHQRRCGIASHLGLCLDAPVIGVAKSRLVGDEVEPPYERGSWAPLKHKGEQIGAVLRTQDGIRPLYVSVGHRIALRTAIKWVLRVTPRYRLPETTRVADRLASRR